MAVVKPTSAWYWWSALGYIVDSDQRTRNTVSLLRWVVLGAVTTAGAMTIGIIAILKVVPY
jgi:hypothetical protein